MTSSKKSRGRSIPTTSKTGKSAGRRGKVLIQRSLNQTRALVIVMTATPPRIYSPRSIPPRLPSFLMTFPTTKAKQLPPKSKQGQRRKVMLMLARLPLRRKRPGFTTLFACSRQRLANATPPLKKCTPGRHWCFELSRNTTLNAQ